MIETGFDARVKINQIVENQLPEFLLSESPKSADFLKQYYISQEYQGGTIDIVENLDQYLKIDNFTAEIIKGTTVLLEDISSTSTTIAVSSTKGFPSQYGLLKIDDEIITYTGVSGNVFTGCIRGFSGITTYRKLTQPETLEFSTSNADSHLENTQVINLSALFLQEFYKKIKYTLTPGLENTAFNANIDVSNFIKTAKSFYQAKGTTESFRILFNVLYGENPSVLDLEKLLIKPSSAEFSRREIVVAELLNPPANPLNLIGQTIFKSADLSTQATISEVEILNRKGKTYYKISLFVGYNDNDLIEGEFNIQPKTKVLESVSIGSSIISVDSTIGFGQTGTLISGTNYINYRDKSVNQFFGCSGVTSVIPVTSDIRSDEIVYGFENGDLSKRVELRFTGVLSKFVPTSNISYTSENEIISVKNIGEVIQNPETNKTRKEVFANSWIYNTSSRYQVSSISGSTFTLLSIPDKSSLRVGDEVDIIVRGTQNIVVPDALVSNINSSSNQVILTNIGSFSPSISLDYDIRRKIRKSSSLNIPLEFGNNNIISDVQNVYVDGDDYGYVASNSLPSYEISKGLTFASIPEATGSPEQSDIGEGYLQGYDRNTLKYSQISFETEVPFISGDAVVYESQNPIPGLVSGETYYIQVLNPSNKIRLYISRSFVGGSAYIQFETLNSGSGIHRFVLNEEKSQLISAQKLLRKFSLDTNLEQASTDKTEPGPIGLLINGVEIVSPKSNDKIYYGPLDSIKILNSGKNYDVLNPPKVVISSPTSGTTALANVVVKGSLKKVTVDPQDFDLNEVVSVTISGGNGTGAILKPIVSKRFRELDFDARTLLNGGGLDLSNETITFRTVHNLTDGEPIVYNANGNAWLGIGSFGPLDFLNNLIQNKTLINGSTYYPKVINSSTIQLYETFNDYFVGINTIGITTENNSGLHKFRTLEKNTLRSIEVINFNTIIKKVTSFVKAGVSTISIDSLVGINTGDIIIGNASLSKSGVSTIISFDQEKQVLTIQDSTVGIITSSTSLKINKPIVNEYENRQLYVKPVGISTFDHTISFNNHNFKHGDLVKYKYTDVPISGLSTENNYYVLKVDNNTFRLSDAGIGTESKNNFERNKFVKFSSTGSGYHIFKYPDISLTVNVSYGGTVVRQISAVPTITGSIVDVYLYENGSGYGSNEIVNLQKNPKVSLQVGKNAEVKPIVRNGRIIQVDVLTGGSEYVSTPELIISGSGTGAIIRPVVQNKKIVDVIVINQGIGYGENTTIKVVPAGSGALLQASIRSLTLNKQFRFNKEILVGTNSNNLQYSWIGYPIDIAQTVFNESLADHSPLIGWAYDGNPIYGPYGYSNSENIGSEIKLLKPGYILDISTIVDRPTNFSPGFFIEDYTFTDSGDLDEHNGRFCKTPEFPLGIYAYFVGINTNPSTNNLDPTYPYFIGNTYRSKLNKDNLVLNQSFDFNKSNLSRNTFPYKVNDPFANNDFLIESNEIVNQISVIDSVASGSVNNLTILEPGDNYKVGDLVNFNNDGTEGGGLSASVSSLIGKKINSLNTKVDVYNNVVFLWKDQDTVIAHYDPYHDLLNNDSIIISGLSTSIPKLLNSHKIRVTSSKTTLFNDIPSNVVPRAVADLYVSYIPKNVSVGSSIIIEDETLEVLNIFQSNSILRVRRADVGSAHTISTNVTILPNNFTIPLKTNYFDSSINKKIFFNPKESVGLGTTVGSFTNINYTVGSVTNTVAVPIQSIYLPNHPFKTGQKVTLSKYFTASSFIVSNQPSGSTFNLPISGNSQTVYIINKSKDFIGITTLVGLTTNTEGLFFASDGDNNYEYALETNFSQVTGNVYKINTTVSIDENHELLNEDQIRLQVVPSLSVGIGQSTKIRVKYENNIRKLVINPVGFDSSSINTTSNIITINSHNLKTGDKIFYNSLDSIALGLSTGTYFVYKVDDNNIQLTETSVDLRSSPPQTVDIISIGGSRHEISLVNPQLLSVKGNNLVFDLTDSSLVNNKLKFYYDANFTSEFSGIGNTSTFNIVGFGTVGVSSIASLTLNYSEKLPSVLYYNLEKFGNINNPDLEVENHSQILFVDSAYSGTYKISGIGTTTFNISLSEIPEKLSYTPFECNALKYTTISKTAKGGVDKVKIIFGGYNYKKIPKFLDIKSAQGKNANIIANVTGIGSINKVRILEQGFDYSSDKTLRPEAYISPFISIINSNTITKVEVFDGGKNYSTPPKLIIKNPNTNEVVDVSGSLKANLSSGAIQSVDIVYPIYGLSSINHEIVPVDNSNGVGISSVLSSLSGIVTCVLATPVLGFSNNLFDIGDKILVEGLEKEGSVGTGLNSEDYNYSYFSVKSFQNTNPAVLEYDISNLTTNPGIAKTLQSSFATIVNKKNIPQFEITQEFAIFSVGEQLLVKDVSDFILRDLYITESTQNYIKVRGTYTLKSSDIVKGKNSGVVCTIDNIIDNRGKFDIEYSVRRDYGWLSDTGKLSELHQVSSDNDYYQNLSYTVKSNIQFKDLIDPVNRLLHTTGLKNFADTQVQSKTGIAYSTISSSDDIIVLDIVDEKRVDAINNFDFGLDINTSQGKSKNIKLKNKKLSDYVSCISNRVLIIDDVSNQFSSRGAGQDLYVNISSIEDTYYNYLVQIIDPKTLNTQISEIVVLSNESDVFTLEKSLLTNTEEILGDISGVIDEFDNRSLRFTPLDPFDTDFDIKILQQEFNSVLPGINTESIGFVNLTGVNTSVGVGTTSRLISFNKNTFNSLFAKIQIINTASNRMNYVELFLDHDNNDTYLSEYYFDTSPGISTNFFGSFNSTIIGNDLELNFYNGEKNNLLIRSKIVGFGTTAIGIGTYRFILPEQIPGNERSAFFESNYEVLSSPANIIGVSTEQVSSVKSVIRVSYGNTSALHQVVMLQDRSNIYTLQYPFLSIGSTSGIGTFGGEFLGTEAILKFYPDDNIIEPILVQLFSEIIYTDSDYLNESPILEYGTVRENLLLSGYDSINGTRANRLSFSLNHQGTPIYAKVFNPKDENQLEYDTGIFTIPDHFFSTGEKLIYTPNSTFVGIGASSVGIGLTLTSSGIVTNKLPQEVYAININSDKFRIATRQDYAYAGIYVTFTSSGSGNAHILEMSKKLEKTILSIDGVVQKPISYVPISYSLENNNGQISASSTYFAVSGISTLKPRDLLKIDDEFVNIISVGIGSTFLGPITGIGTYLLVESERGFAGTSATTHTDFTKVQLYRGSFNIVNSSVYFTEAPKGSGRNRNDVSNIPFPYADFGGRTYLRNDYTNNLLFDDISDQFTGIGQTYGLSIQGIKTAGIETGSGVLFINGIFQTPTTINNAGNNYNVVTNSGISSVVFSGITSSNGDLVVSTFDVNQNQLPRGGMIVSLGSTSGLGFAPLVGAKVKAIVGVGGSIVRVTGDPYTGTGKNVSTAYYNNSTGIVEITTLQEHELKTGDLIKLVGLAFTCPSNAGIMSYFPLSDLSGSYGVSGITSENTFSAFVGYSTLPHTYVGMGTIFPWYNLNYGSGYRNPVSIAVTDSNHVGTSASISAIVGVGGTLSFVVNSGGSGYTTSSVVVSVSEPSYENLEVIGVSRRGIGNTTDTGRNLLLTLEVGASSTTGIGSTLFEVSSFKISRPGYGFQIGDVFKPVGLVTDKNLSAPLSEFELTVLDTFTDTFSTWQFGELDYIDSIENLQNSVRVRFPLYYNNQLLSFEKDSNSLIDLSSILLIFVNGVIQEPGIAYQFDGGTTFTFTEPPKTEDKISIFFYRGTREIDSKQVNINETIKTGDFVQLYKNDLYPETITQDIRRINSIPASDTLETDIYSNQGVDEVNYKPFVWTKQKVDQIISGDYIYKSRDSLESQIYPTARIISNLDQSSSNIFVDNVRFFNYEEDNYSTVINNFDALIVQSVNPVSAALTAVVSVAGTVQSLNIINPGSGYVGNSIEIKISNPKSGIGIGSVATATASIINGSISSPVIINPGFGYTQTNPPQVILDNPPFEFETVKQITNVEGFSGIVTGITTASGEGGHSLSIKFFLNNPSFAGLQTGYPIYIFDTFVGTGITSIDFDNSSVIGIGTEYLDNIYIVHSLSVAGSNAELISNISTNSNIVGITTFGSISSPVGKFSWGRLYNFNRPNAVSIAVTGFTVDSGLSTFPTIQRRNYGLRQTGAIVKTSNI